MLDEASKLPPAKPQAPEWVRTYAPFLGRLWGDGVTKIPPLAINTAVLDWGRDDAKSLREAARWIAERRTAEGSASALRLMTILQRYPDRLATLIRSRPEALEEAVEIVIQEPAKLRKVLLRQGYTDMRTVGGCLDRDM